MLGIVCIPLEIGYQCVSVYCILAAVEEEVVDILCGPRAVGAMGVVDSIDSVEVFVEGDMACSELC
jgi:hypothetical protein